MPITLDGAFGLHAEALKLRGRRAEVLASNIANADTPNFKARDFDIALQLKKLQQQQAAQPAARSLSSPPPVQYRVPLQSAIDGNSVDMQREQVAFAQNAVRYQASLRFLDGKIKSLLLAIKGD